MEKEPNMYVLLPLPKEQVNLQKSVDELVEMFSKIDRLSKMTGNPALSINLYFAIERLFQSIYKVASSND